MGDKWRRRGKIQKSSNVLECPASGSVLGASTSVGIAELLKVKVRLSAGLRPVLRVRVWVLRTHSCLSIERLLLLSEPWQAAHALLERTKGEGGSSGAM